MHRARTWTTWLVAGAFALCTTLGTNHARAEDGDLEGLPYILFAAALTTTFILIAINDSGSSSDSGSNSSSDSGSTSTSTDALRFSPLGAPPGPSPVLGFRGAL